jgi:hypothetical protein
MRRTGVFVAALIGAALLAATATAQVTMTCELGQPDGWMKGGYGNVKYTFKNEGETPGKIVAWKAQWEVNGELFGEEPATDEDVCELPAGKETTVSKIGWLDPEVAEKADPGNAIWVGSYTVEVGDERIEVPFRIEVPEAVMKEPMVLVEGEHISYEVTQSHYEALGANAERLLRWLNQSYEAMTDLVGQEPYGGKMIVIKESPPHPWYAYAGNPIIMDTTYMDALIEEINKGIFPFGWIHEMGHDFDIAEDMYGDWYIWSGGTCEGEANLKLVYAHEAIPDQDWKAKWSEDENAVYPTPVKDMLLDGKQCMDSRFLFAIDTYLADPTIPWEEGFCQHIFLQRIARVYGWDPVKKWYRTYAALQARGCEKPETPTEKVQLMAAVLSETTGADLVHLFQVWRAPVTADDVAAMKQRYPIEEAVKSIVLTSKEAAE